MKYIVKFLFILMVSFLVESAFAGKMTKEEIEDARKKVWNWDMPEFRQKTIPEEYKGKRSVILASHDRIIVDRRGSMNQLLFFTMEQRRMVYISDQKTLDNHSEISYIENRFSYGNYCNVVIGVRLIKPDGTINEVDMDNAVSMKKGKGRKEKDAYCKLAIPDLQVGDIVDYFVQYTTLVDKATFAHSDDFTLPTEYDLANDNVLVLNYSFYCELDPKLGYLCKSINGAPKTKLSVNAEGNNVFELRCDKIDPIMENSWILKERDFPKIRFILRSKTKVIDWLGRRNLCELYKQKYDELKKNSGVCFKKEISAEKKKRPDMTDVELADLLFNKFVAPLNRDPLLISYITISNFGYWNAGSFLETLKYFGIEAEVGIVTRHDSYRYSDALLMTDLNFVVRLKKSGKVYATSPFEDNMSTVIDGHHLSYYYEGEPVLYITEEKNDKDKNDKWGLNKYFMNPTSDESEIITSMLDTVPLQKSSDNNVRHECATTFTVADCNSMDVVCNAIYSGYLASGLRNTFQPEDEWKSIFKEDACKQNKSKIKVRKEDYFSLGKKAEIERKKQIALKEMPKTFFRDLNIIDIQSNKIVDFGYTLANPQLKMQTKCKVDGLVRTAGDRWLVDLGKLMGKQSAIIDTTDIRVADLYFKYPRSYDYELKLTVPVGFFVSNLESFNKELKNNCGEVTSKAIYEGNIVTIHVHESYEHNFEPAIHYKEMAALFNAIYDLSRQSVVLSKEEIKEKTILIEKINKQKVSTVKRKSAKKGV